MKKIVCFVLCLVTVVTLASFVGHVNNKGIGVKAAEGDYAGSEVMMKPSPVVVEPAVEPATEPETEATTEPVTEPVTQPVTEPETTPSVKVPETETAPVVEKPKPEKKPVEKPEEAIKATEPATEPVTKPTPSVSFSEVSETVYATGSVNVRTGPSTDYEKIGKLKWGESVTRIGVGDNGWSKVSYNDDVAYISSKYLSTSKPVDDTASYPMHYSDSTCTITIYKEWYENAYVYAAHLRFSDYSRFGTSCANGKYDNGYETTSHAAKRLGAIFAVNGCYSAPYLDYTVVRSGVLCNNGKTYSPAIYSKNNGLFRSPETAGFAGTMADELVAEGKVTDTFCFGPQILSGGSPVNCKDTSRAQRTFIGTNGSAGDIWVCVSDGRKNDGRSSGLTYGQCARFLASKGCSFGIPLDGGGSSTMYFNGKVLNAAKGNQRSVVDFVYFK